MRPGQSVEFAGRTITMSDYDLVQGPNYEAKRGRFTVKGPMGEYDLRSEKRWHPSAQTQTTEAGIRVGALGNLYISIGDENGQGVVVRMWNHPLIVWIWVGGFVMSIGGLVSLSDRRVRVGSTAKTAPAPAPQPIPAE